eukprot:9484795-Pyramimonas_sp.AAC.2
MSSMCGVCRAAQGKIVFNEIMYNEAKSLGGKGGKATTKPSGGNGTAAVPFNISSIDAATNGTGPQSMFRENQSQSEDWVEVRDHTRNTIMVDGVVPVTR